MVIHEPIKGLHSFVKMRQPRKLVSVRQSPIRNVNDQLALFASHLDHARIAVSSNTAVIEMATMRHLRTFRKT